MSNIKRSNILSLVFIMISFASNILLNSAFKSKFSHVVRNQIVRALTTDVFVGNLPNDIDQGSLESFVQEKIGGGYSRVKLATDRDTGSSRGFGYISFEEKSSADNAISILTGAELQGRQLKIDIATPKVPKTDGSGSASGGRPSTEPKQSVYVGNLSYETTAEDLGAFCDEVLGKGSYKDIRLSFDRDTGRSKGFAHVEFTNEAEVTKAVELLSGKEMGGRTLKVDIAQTKDKNAPRTERAPFAPRGMAAGGATGGAGGSRSQQHSVFIGNLAWSVDENLIKEMVNDVLGPDLFVSVRLAIDRETGRSRGFGHVDFKDAESAARAVQELNDLEVEGRQIRADHAQSKTGGTTMGGGMGGGGGSRGGFNRGAPRTSGSSGRGGDRYGGEEGGNGGGEFQKW